MKVLVTGFDKFGENKENPTSKMIEALDGEFKEGHVRLMNLSVCFKNCFKEISEEIDRFKPDSVLMFGLNTSISNFQLEKIAINFMHSKISDNSGVHPQHQAITRGGTDAYFSTLDVESFLGFEELKLSLSAGSYVCNYLMYRTLEKLNGSGVKAGFIHVPANIEMRSDSRWSQVEINEMCKKLINFAIKH